MEIIFTIIYIISAVSIGGTVTFSMLCIVLALIDKEKSQIVLHENEEKFRSLFNAINDIIIVFDPETLEIVEINQEAIDSLGYSKTDLIAMSVEMLSTSYDEARMKQLIHEWITKPSEDEVNDTIKRADGTKFPVNIKVAWTVLNTRRLFIAIYRDMSVIEAARSEIAERIDELKHLVDFLSGRELKMIELKNEVNTLLSQKAKRPRYKIPIIE